MEQSYLGIPDFEDMNEAELLKFWSRYHHPSRKEAQALIGPGFANKDAVRAAENLACYAISLSCARGLRLQGKIAQAMTYEHACGLALERLPEALQW